MNTGQFTSARGCCPGGQNDCNTSHPIAPTIEDTFDGGPSLSWEVFELPQGYNPFVNDRVEARSYYDEALNERVNLRRYWRKDGEVTCFSARAELGVIPLGQNGGTGVLFPTIESYMQVRAFRDTIPAEEYPDADTFAAFDYTARNLGSPNRFFQATWSSGGYFGPAGGSEVFVDPNDPAWPDIPDHPPSFLARIDICVTPSPATNSFSVLSVTFYINDDVKQIWTPTFGAVELPANGNCQLSLEIGAWVHSNIQDAPDNVAWVDNAAIYPCSCGQLCAEQNNYIETATLPKTPFGAGEEFNGWWARDDNMQTGAGGLTYLERAQEEFQSPGVRGGGVEHFGNLVAPFGIGDVMEIEFTGFHATFEPSSDPPKMLWQCAVPLDWYPPDLGGRIFLSIRQFVRQNIFDQQFYPAWIQGDFRFPTWEEPAADGDTIKIRHTCIEEVSAGTKRILTEVFLNGNLKWSTDGGAFTGRHPDWQCRFAYMIASCTPASGVPANIASASLDDITFNVTRA